MRKSPYPSLTVMVVLAWCFGGVFGRDNDHQKVLETEAAFQQDALPDYAFGTTEDDEVVIPPGGSMDFAKTFQFPTDTASRIVKLRAQVALPTFFDFVLTDAIKSGNKFTNKYRISVSSDAPLGKYPVDIAFSFLDQADQVLETEKLSHLVNTDSGEPPAGDDEDEKILHFAQFGNGGGVFFSQLTLINRHPSEPARVQISIKDDGGLPLAMKLNQEMAVGGEMEVTIPPGGVRVLETDGLGEILVGSVSVSADQTVSGILMFGGSLGLAGVESSRATSRPFLVPVETRSSRGYNTGIAVQNLEKEPLELGLDLLDQDGQVVATAIETPRLPGEGHQALFVTEIDWDKEVDFADFQGLLRVTPSGKVAATALKTSLTQLASLPVVIP
ncbi:MAG: hypothetical protein ACE5JX_23060 [Acidobacteriota bacterium]